MGDRNRRCVVTGSVLPVEQLVRFVAAPEGEIVADVLGKLPGRGVWVTASRSVIEQAIERRSFVRGLKQPVLVPDDLADRVEGLLAGRCLNLLGLCCRAGLIVLGFEKVRAALKGRPVVALIAADDAAADGRQKLQRLSQHFSPVPVLVDVFGGTELSLAFGRPNVVHAALLSGGLAAHFITEFHRLGGFRSSVLAKAD